MLPSGETVSDRTLPEPDRAWQGRLLPGPTAESTGGEPADIAPAVAVDQKTVRWWRAAAEHEEKQQERQSQAHRSRRFWDPIRTDLTNVLLTIGVARISMHARLVNVVFDTVRI